MELSIHLLDSVMVASQISPADLELCFRSRKVSNVHLWLVGIRVSRCNSKAISIAKAFRVKPVSGVVDPKM